MASAASLVPLEPRLRAAEVLLARLSWTVLLVGLATYQVVQTISHGQSPKIVLTTLAIFFPLLMLRLAVVAYLSPGRRLALLLLLGAVASWSLGSTTVNVARVEEVAEFPSPGELFFLISYLGMVGYLLRDVDRRHARPARAWLDIAVICGGTSCLASLLLVTPIRSASGYDGATLLLSLVYPIADTVLALLALGQSIVLMRSDRRTSIMLGSAFVLLAVADSSFALRGSASTYDFGNLGNALWGGGFALLVAAACRPPRLEMDSVPKAVGPTLLVTAGIIALTVLTIRPDETIAHYTLPPALLTMLAVAARMGLALRDANRANEAFALSETDDLTKLPNRRAVRARLSEAVADHRPMALMLLDLDGFKEINDSLGHRAGDTVLELVAVRIRESVDSHAQVARLGGDEFAIVVGTDDEIELMETAHHVRDELARPIIVDGIQLRPSGSIGVTVVRADDHDPGDVLRRADVAMYQAKASGLGATLYDADLDEFSRSRLQLAEELRRGLANGEIELWFQPQLDASTGLVRGLEALVRWSHPTQGLISPVSFLPAARRAGLMGQLSDSVARQAARHLRVQLDAGIDLPVAINCAPPELLGRSFLPYLYSCLDEHGVPGDRLVLEITEDSFLSDPHRAREILVDLRRHGVQVSIDDYGTGFSSLAYLRNLPVQELKIDRSLTGNVSGDDRIRMIVASTIQLAHALDLRIVAEGVENTADLESLASMGIDVVQGYHLARPMPAGQVIPWLRSRHPDQPPAQATA